MGKSISPFVAAAVIGVIILIAAVVIWRGSQSSVKLPDKPPSGPIVLPPSQQGRTLPAGHSSGPVPQ